MKKTILLILAMIALSLTMVSAYNIYNGDFVSLDISIQEAVGDGCPPEGCNASVYFADNPYGFLDGQHDGTPDIPMNLYSSEHISYGGDINFTVLYFSLFSPPPTVTFHFGYVDESNIANILWLCNETRSVTIFTVYNISCSYEIPKDFAEVIRPAIGANDVLYRTFDAVITVTDFGEEPPVEEESTTGGPSNPPIESRFTNEKEIKETMNDSSAVSNSSTNAFVMFFNNIWNWITGLFK